MAVAVVAVAPAAAAAAAAAAVPAVAAVAVAVAVVVVVAVAVAVAAIAAIVAYSPWQENLRICEYECAVPRTHFPGGGGHETWPRPQGCLKGQF